MYGILSCIANALNKYYFHYFTVCNIGSVFQFIFSIISYNNIRIVILGNLRKKEKHDNFIIFYFKLCLASF